MWEYLSHSFAHLALVAGTTPDNKYIDTVVGLAQRGALFLFDLGYFKVTALAQIAEAEAYFLTRLNHQTALYEAVAGRLRPGGVSPACSTPSRAHWSSTRCIWARATRSRSA